MKKKHLFSFLVLFAITLAMAFVGITSFDKKEVAFAASSAPPLTIFDFISINQEGQTFTEENLEKTELSNVVYYNLYTTKAVTINRTVTLASKDRFSVQIFDETNQIFKDATSTVINDVAYYTFSGDATSNDNISKVTVTYSKANPVTKENPTGQPTIYTLNLNILHVKLNFAKSTDFNWSYTASNVTKTMSAPSNGCEYTPLTLTIPNGTELNPITVKFKYCGETYEIYNINGVYYNALVGEPGQNQLDFSTLTFSVSGTYTVEIYDKTAHSAYDDANYLKYDFTIEQVATASNRFAPFYIHARTEDGEQIMNQQISNAKTIVEFINVGYVKTYLDYITVRKSYRPTGGENITETTRYGGDKIPSSLTFEDDGTYNIDVYANGQTRPIKRFEFILLGSIRSLFEVDGTKYEITDDGEVLKNGEVIKEGKPNQKQTILIDRTVSSSYNNGMIDGISTYTFDLMIAKSMPSINGVNDNARTSDAVNITVNGVGTINVSITQDGKTYNKTAQNGDLTASFSDPGKYFIKITDEMGTTVAKSFTVTIKMNTAAIALIIIAAAIIVIMIIFIITSRTKIKVR